MSSTDRAITLEVTLNPDSVSLRPVTVDGKEYVEVSVAGWAKMAEPGAPALPMAHAALGVPFGADLTVSVVPGRVHIVQMEGDASPADAIPLGVQEAGLPLARSFRSPRGVSNGTRWCMARPRPFPGKLAEIVSDGVLRQQRIAGVAVYPVQYHPLTRQIEVYESLIVEIRLDGGAEPEAVKPESRAIESLLGRGLLNGKPAAQWRGTSDLLDRSDGVPWAPPEPGYKIQVEQEGMYKVTYSALAAAGVPVDQVDPRTFRVYSGGSEVAIYVEGESDGHFDTPDYLLFYGTAIQSKYTRYNVYWLGYGQGPGLRMASRERRSDRRQPPGLLWPVGTPRAEHVLCTDPAG